MGGEVLELLHERAKRLEREAEQRGLEQGLERGLEQGREQGLAQGREQGLEQGLAEGRLRMLAELVADGVISVSDAASKLGVSIAEFEQMASQLV